jgi:hypothetical protein
MPVFGDYKIMIDNIENFMNKLTDMDWGWWPVLFLRPAKDKDIDNLVLLKMSLIFGSVIGILLLLLYLALTRTSTLGCIVFFILLGWILFFINYKFTFAYFWNRRARRLRGN